MTTDVVAPVRRIAPEARVTEQFEVRAIEDDGVYLTGVAAPYNTWTDVGSYDERFAPRVFATSLDRRRGAIPLCVNHRVTEIAVGRPVEWQEADDCLRGVWQFDSRPEAQEVARLAKDGILTGLSVHFAPGRGKHDNTIERVDGRPKVTRHNARLMEVSLVTVAAYEGAEVTAVRTAGIADLEANLSADETADRLRAQMAVLNARLAVLEEVRK